MTSEDHEARRTEMGSRAQPAGRDTDGPRHRLVIVEDHETARDGLALVLEREGFDVVGTAGSAAEGLELVVRLEPDAAVVGINLPDETGIALTRRLASSAPETGVLLYTAHDEAESVSEALESGARGYALKSGSSEETIRAVRAVATGGTYVDPAMRAILLDGTVTAKVAVLTHREREVLARLGHGRSLEEIGEDLFISPETARTHIRNAMRKLEARTRTHAIVLALRSGEIRLED
jgi:DNA-binding NarL/FixJ family response regulator